MTLANLQYVSYHQLAKSSTEVPPFAEYIQHIQGLMHSKNY